MAEFNTSQAAKLVANTKLLPNESAGRVRILAAKMPATYASPQIADTIFIGRIPVNSRILLGGFVSCAAGTASSTLSIGLRSTKTGTVVSATAIASGVDVAAAGQKAANNGANIANGVEYVTTEEVDVYATVAGAAVAANQALKFEIPYVTD